MKRGIKMTQWIDWASIGSFLSHVAVGLGLLFIGVMVFDKNQQLHLYRTQLMLLGFCPQQNPEHFNYFFQSSHDLVVYIGNMTFRVKCRHDKAIRFKDTDLTR